MVNHHETHHLGESFFDLFPSISSAKPSIGLIFDVKKVGRFTIHLILWDGDFPKKYPAVLLQNRGDGHQDGLGVVSYVRSGRSTPIISI